jgi:hypothetical protein
MTMGYEWKFGIGPQHASNLATRQFEFQAVDINKRDNLIRANGIRGQRSPVGDYTQKGIFNVSGTVTILPRPDDLVFLLPYILGGTPVSDVFPLAETIPDFVVTVDKGTHVETSRGCKVNQAIFRSSQGQPLQLELQIEGKDMDAKAASGSFPAISGTMSEKLPFVHHQAIWTFASQNLRMNNLVLTINNNLELDHHNNSQARTDLPEGERMITLAFNSGKWSATEYTNLLDIAAAGVTGADLEYTDGTDDLIFTFGRLQKPETPLDVSGKDSVRPQITLEAFEDLDGTEPQMIVECTNVVV